MMMVVFAELLLYVRCGESGMETCTPPYEKQIASGNWLYDTGSSTGALDNLEGWDGAGGGKKVQEGGDICIPMADSCSCVAETNTALQSSHLSFKISGSLCCTTENNMVL